MLLGLFFIIPDVCYEGYDSLPNVSEGACTVSGGNGDVTFE